MRCAAGAVLLVVGAVACNAIIDAGPVPDGSGGGGDDGPTAKRDAGDGGRSGGGQDGGRDGRTDARGADRTVADAGNDVRMHDAPRPFEAGRDAPVASEASPEAGPASDAGRDARSSFDGSHDAGQEAGPSPPVLLSPLSTSHVSSWTPTLRWSGIAGMAVTVCSDHALTQSCQHLTPTGMSAKPATALTVGTHFWNVVSAAGALSQTWEFTVSESDVGDTSWGTMLDLDGDGRADMAVAEANSGPMGPSAGGVGQVWIYSAKLAGSSDAGLVRVGAGLLVGPAEEVDGGWVGRSIASAGDVNGDGYADLIVGAPDTNGEKGAAFVFLGSKNGLSTTPQTLVGESIASAQFGWSVASAGDLNEDGYADVLVGAPGAQKVYVFLGSANGLGHMYSMSLVGNGGGFGYSVAGVGDVNGDGHADVVVGSEIAGAMLFLGSSQGPSAPGLPFEDPQTDAGTDEFGVSVATAGDVNGDGLPDVIIGAPGGNCAGAENTGCAYVYRGQSGTTGLGAPIATLKPTADDGNGSDFFGTTVACAGDVNGDGKSDLLVGAPSVFSASWGSYYFATPLAQPPQPVFLNTGAVPAGTGDLYGTGQATFAAGYFASPLVGRVVVYTAPLSYVQINEPGDASFADFGESIFGATN